MTVKHSVITIMQSLFRFIKGLLPTNVALVRFPAKAECEGSCALVLSYATEVFTTGLPPSGKSNTFGLCL